MDDLSLGEFLGIGVGMFALALLVKPLRKALGLLIVILGIIATLTGIGAILGIPMILVGGILIFL